MADLHFHTRADCGLCDRLLSLLGPHLAERSDLRMVKVDIAGNAELEAAYGLRIPVVTVGGRVILEGRPDAEAVAAAVRGIPRS